MARVAEGPRRDEAVAAGQRVEDVCATLRRMDLPNAHCGSICLEPVGDLDAAHAEVRRADERHLRRHTVGTALYAALITLGAVLVVLSLALDASS